MLYNGDGSSQVTQGPVQLQNQITGTSFLILTETAISGGNDGFCSFLINIKTVKSAFYSRLSPPTPEAAETFSTV